METLLKTEGLTVVYNADDREYVCDLSAIPSGYYVCVNLCTQARYTGKFWLDEEMKKGDPSMGRYVLMGGRKTDENVDFHVISVCGGSGTRHRASKPLGAGKAEPAIRSVPCKQYPGK